MGYVEDGYSEGYVEGDSPTVLAECDLTNVNAQLALIKQQNIDLNAKLDTILAKVNSSNTLNLNIVDTLTNVSTKTDIDNIRFPTVDLSNIATKDFITSYIDESVPFVDDMSVKVYPNGTNVSVTGYDGSGIVVSSQLLPYEDFTYTVTYNVSFDVNGVANVSTFLAQQVVKITPEA